MFEYFPNHYSWDLGLLMAVQLGRELSEYDEARRPLIEVAKRPGARAIWQFILPLVMVLVVLIAVPETVTWLPQHFGFR